MPLPFPSQRRFQVRRQAAAREVAPSDYLHPPKIKPKLVTRIAFHLLPHHPTMKAILINWKTTLFGIGTLAGGIAAGAMTLADGWQSGDLDALTAAGAAITGGFAMIFARDADKSSQDSGVRR